MKSGGQYAFLEEIARKMQSLYLFGAFQFKNFTHSPF